MDTKTAPTTMRKETDALVIDLAAHRDEFELRIGARRAVPYKDPLPNPPVRLGEFHGLNDYRVYPDDL